MMSNQTKSEYLDKILVRGNVFQIGGRIYIPSGQWKGNHKLIDIQIHNKSVLFWVKLEEGDCKGKLTVFNEDEVFSK